VLAAYQREHEASLPLASDELVAGVAVHERNLPVRVRRLVTKLKLVWPTAAWYLQAHMQLQLRSDSRCLFFLNSPFLLFFLVIFFYFFYAHRVPNFDLDSLEDTERAVFAALSSYSPAAQISLSRLTSTASSGQVHEEQLGVLSE
jgi:hypothetical protein